ncbi:MAG: hypothetical protein ABS81_18335 [Pseudonocardia sp. SCN 72-86]|nr:MAG: hypothetical protein ABS81_18335 [Pseudonocardia sp. SCN 72-86]
MLDGDSGEILAAISHGVDDDVDMSSVGMLAAAGNRLSGAVGHGVDDPVDDVTVTSRRSFHVLRPVEAAGRTAIVYLRLQRGRSNLAVARRGLAVPEVAAAVAELVAPGGARGGSAHAGTPQSRVEQVHSRIADRTQPSPYPRSAPQIPLQSNGYAADPRPGGDVRPSPPAAMSGGSALPGPRGALPVREPAAFGRAGEPVRSDTAERADPGAGWSRTATAATGTAASQPVLPRRTRGTAPPAPPVSPRATTRAAAGAPGSWADDIPTMKRLLAGLRRMM